MARRSKRKKRGGGGRRGPGSASADKATAEPRSVPTSPEPTSAPSERARPEDDAPRAPARAGRGWKLWGAIALLGGGAAAGAVYLSKRIAVVETRDIIGNTERCQSCHPDGALAASKGAHPPVKGHADLGRLGCIPCHGGDPTKVDASAHSRPPAGDFFARPHVAANCVRCHLPGDDAVPALAAGQRAYVEAGCVGCHLPGGDRASLDRICASAPRGASPTCGRSCSSRARCIRRA